MIQVAIIEDDEEIRKAIESYLNLQDDMCCRWSHESVEHFLNHIQPDNLPDIILMDIGLPGMSGINGIKIIKEPLHF